MQSNNVQVTNNMQNKPNVNNQNNVQVKPNVNNSNIQNKHNVNSQSNMQTRPNMNNQNIINTSYKVINRTDFSKMPVVNAVNTLIITAINAGASDLHFDPTDDGI